MPIRFACPRCEKTLKVDDRFGGRRAKCPNCRAAIEIPAQAAAAVAPVSGGVAPTNEPPAAASSVNRSSADEVAQAPGGIGQAPDRASLSQVHDRRANDADENTDEHPGGNQNSPASVDGTSSEVVGRGQETSTERDAKTLPDVDPSAASAGSSSDSLPGSAPDSTTPPPPPVESAVPTTRRPAPVALPPIDAPPDDREEERFASPFEVFDDDAEIVYADEYGSEEPERFLVSRTRLAIPRAYVYLQGALLVAVAVLSFAFGWAFGGSGSYRAREAPSGPVTLSGVVRVDGYDGPIAASEGALVAILPNGRRPAEKIPVDGLRPSEIGRIVPPRTLGAIREMGGALAVSDDRGRFRAELPQPGEYHVLVVLPDVYRPTTSQIALADLARLGDYFLLPDQLIGDCRYALQAERIGESKSIEVRFP